MTIDTRPDPLAAHLAGSPEVDWREPHLRRGVFLDFYDFHTRYGAHPGGVYFLIPYLRDAFGWTDEELFWFCFLNGNTQNPLTSYLLWRVAPTPRQADALGPWFNANYGNLAFDTDRRHHKTHLLAAVDGYRSMVGDVPQRKFWNDAAAGGFAGLWAVGSSIPFFGRLSTWSYMDYLHIAGVAVNCDTLMLDDMSGSKSHRNGIAKVSGNDQWDWHQSNPDFDGHYDQEMLGYLDNYAWGLLAQAQQRAAPAYARDVTLLTLESGLCTYKSWYRRRRYPNVYMDMMYDRITQSERRWPEVDFGLFWQARRDRLPPHLLLEENPGDPGVKPVKQSWFAETGQVIMMEHEHPVYVNEYATAVAENRWGTFR